MNKLKILCVGMVSVLNVQMWGSSRQTQMQGEIEQIQNITNLAGQKILEIEIDEVMKTGPSYNQSNDQYRKNIVLSALTNYFVEKINNGGQEDAVTPEIQVIQDCGIKPESLMKSSQIQRMLDGESARVILGEMIATSNMSLIEKLHILMEFEIISSEMHDNIMQETNGFFKSKMINVLGQIGQAIGVGLQKPEQRCSKTS